MQHTRKRRWSIVLRVCDFECVAFSALKKIKRCLTGCPWRGCNSYGEKGCFWRFESKVWSTWTSEVKLSPPRARPLKNSMRNNEIQFEFLGCKDRSNRKGETVSLRARTCVKRNVVSGARFKGLSLYFLYQRRSLIRIKTGLDTYLIRIQTRSPLSRYPHLWFF